MKIATLFLVAIMVVMEQVHAKKKHHNPNSPPTSNPNPAQPQSNCDQLPSHDALQAALRASVKPAGGPSNGGLDFHMWGAIVDRSGIVCQIAYSGTTWKDQWLASRIIAAQKAVTANSLSQDVFALSTANLFSAVQPGGPLYGLQESNPVNPVIGYAGNVWDFGTTQDPMIGQRIGGINVFGGGLALYEQAKTGAIHGVGGLGVSGDMSCADHLVAWRVRTLLSLDANVNLGGVGGLANSSDAMIYDRRAATVAESGTSLASASGYGHPLCTAATRTIGKVIRAAYDTVL